MNRHERSTSTPEDPPRSRVAVCERPSTHRPRGGIWRPGGHLHRVPPVERGSDVLMVSGTDEHGTPVMVAADQDRRTSRVSSPIATTPSSGMTCAELGLFVRPVHADDETQNHHEGHARRVPGPSTTRGSFSSRPRLGAFSATTGQTLRSLHRGRVPDLRLRVARGDQCDNCGNQLDPVDLINPRSKVDGAPPVFKETSTSSSTCRPSRSSCASGSSSRRTGGRTCGASRSSWSRS